MCPVLARPGFFLEALNSLRSHKAAAGSMEHELQALLLQLARSVQHRQPIDRHLLARVNDAFGKYQSVRLILKAPDPVVHGENGARSNESQLLQLQAEFADPPGDLRRIYMEGIVSLLEAMETGRLRLQNCELCGNWLIPYERAQVSKFCSTRCRNRHHYLVRKNDANKEAAAT